MENAIQENTTEQAPNTAEAGPSNENMVDEISENLEVEEASLEQLSTELEEESELAEDFEEKGLMGKMNEMIKSSKLIKAATLALTISSVSPNLAKIISNSGEVNNLPTSIEALNSGNAQKKDDANNISLEERLAEMKTKLVQDYYDREDVTSMEEAIEIFSSPEVEQKIIDDAQEAGRPLSDQEITSLKEKRLKKLTEMSELFSKKREIGESQRGEMLEHVSSKEYLDKLIKEVDGDEELAKYLQKDRIKNLNSVNITPWIMDGSMEDAKGWYNPNMHQIFLSAGLNYKELERVAAHEFGHALTNRSGISYQASRQLNDSFESPLSYMKDKDAIERHKEKEYDKYFSDETEMLTRKMALDKDLKELGIKKYEEDFTIEHYKKMKEAYKKGELSSDSNEFIITTKDDFDTFKDIMDNIAENEKRKLSSNIA